MQKQEPSVHEYNRVTEILFCIPTSLSYLAQAHSDQMGMLFHYLTRKIFYSAADGSAKDIAKTVADTFKVEKEVVEEVVKGFGVHISKNAAAFEKNIKDLEKLLEDEHGGEGVTHYRQIIDSLRREYLELGYMEIDSESRRLH